jgi:hypothetical protein
MTTISRNVQQRAAAKEERARDAALAIREYEAEKRAVDGKTARLRALRLAKEAETNPVFQHRPCQISQCLVRRTEEARHERS